MAPVVWGLDLREIQWSKFKSSYMWNNEYHLRRTKFIIYQCAMIFCVVSESLGTAALSDYVDQQNFVQNLDNSALEYNDDYIGVASFNIFAGVYTATIFGGAFFFDLFWPERQESRSVRLAWKICGVLACVMVLADGLALTIITATHAASVSGVGSARAQQLLDAYAGSPLIYRHNGRAVASVVFIWPGFVFTVISCIILFMSIIHDDRLGPLSTHARTQRELKQDVETGTPQSIEDVDKEPEKEDSTHVAPVRPHSAQTADQAYPEV